jgi:Glycosyl hydrolase family 81 C-terminal domain/Glycosyl hydrolase family 81 N-terminal domain
MSRDTSRRGGGGGQPTRTSPKFQFHYFYGSVGSGGGGGGGSSAGQSPHDDTSDERDSLVGESLVSTDNEGGGGSLLGTGGFSDRDHDDLAGKDEYDRLLRSTNALPSSSTTTNNGNKRNGHSNNKNNVTGDYKSDSASASSSSPSHCCNSPWFLVICLLIIGSLTTVMGIIFIVPHSTDSLSPLPSSSSGTSGRLSSSSFPTQTFTIPFPKVDRSDFGDPVENFIDTTLFHPNLLNNKGSGSTPSSQTFQFPFPTGAFWTNMIVHSPQGDVSYPIAVYPYAYRWSPTSLQVSYPAAHRVLPDTNTISDTFAPDLSIGTKEKITNRYVTAFDPLSVTLRFVTDANSKWETALVQGSPYVTLQYLSQTPVFRPISIFDAVQCPGDDDENFSDMEDDETASTTSTSSSSKGGFLQNRKMRSRRTMTTMERTTTTTIGHLQDQEQMQAQTQQQQPDRDDSTHNTRRRLFGVCSIDDSDSQITTMRGVQFIFKTPEGASWIMFSSEPMNLVFDNIRKTTITSAAPFTGIIRLAYVPADKTLGETTTTHKNENTSNNNMKTFGSSTGLRRLIYHADAYPVGGQVSYEFQSSSISSSSSTSSSSSKSSAISTIDQNSRRATVTFSFATRSMMGSSITPTAPTNNLLMLALPHHSQLIPSSSAKLSRNKFDLTYQCIKGNMTAIVGSTWSYEEPLYDLAFDGPPQPVDAGVRDLILDQILDDLDRVLPTFSENVYGYGKQVARIAQLVHIADRLEPKPLTNMVESNGGNSTSTTTDESVLGKAKNTLSKYLESFLSSKVSDAFLFDSNMGGLVSTNGLHDKGEDFGNGRYNDHHFHLGSVTIACNFVN